jgi:hypothetical protein
MRIKRFNEMKVNDPEHRCKICGAPMYRTDSGGPTVTLQCSSDEAKFWNFNRGTKLQNDSHKHFTDSMIHISLEEWNHLETY